MVMTINLLAAILIILAMVQTVCAVRVVFYYKRMIRLFAKVKRLETLTQKRLTELDEKLDALRRIGK